ncbi:waterproof [Carabus blaptoides fortunei]
MKNLKSLIHVSTVYSNCHLQKIEERFYKYPVNYEDLPKILEKLDDRAAEELTPQLLGDWPNTYTFTKAMAEAMIRDQGSNLPIAIFRPGIIVSTWKEPLKGWIDNVYGPNGICAGALMGILGSLWCDENVSANIVPVDMTINALLAVAWSTATKYQLKNDLEIKNETEMAQNNLSLNTINRGNIYEVPPQPSMHRNDSDIRIYNYVSTVEKPLDWSEYCGINLIYGQKYPLSDAIWVLNFGCTKSGFLHSVYMVFLHLIPAILVDALTLLCGKKPRMVKVYKQMEKFTKILSYFSNNEWLFTNNNVQQLWQTLDVTDKKLFHFSMADMDWLEYFRNYTLGLRVYLYKDDVSTLPAARRKQLRFFVASKLIYETFSYYRILSIESTKMAEAIGDVDILRRIEDTTLNDQSLARDAHIVKDWTMKDSAIRQFLKDRCILITGVTGFLGIIILEKLLRTCPEIRAIFVLIRKSSTKDVTQRLDELFKNPVFNILRKQRPNFHRKVFPVQGDMQEIGLGLNLEDRHKIQDQVSVIIHGAATVRFDEALKTAVKVNVRGTGEMIKLARGCARLASFVHISTAYANFIPKTDEKFYDPPTNACDLIDMVENTDDGQLEIMTPKILGRYPNTYTFTKGVTEGLILEQARGLPLSIIRPSIVVSTYREPVRGWTCTPYGPGGIVAGAGVGFIHSVYCNKDNIADLVPVDMVVNCIIASAWKTAIDGVPSGEPKIYNYVSGNEAPITWDRFCKLNKEYGIPFPTVHAVWYYSFALNKNLLIHWIVTIFMNLIPAIFIDLFDRLRGKKPRFLKLCKKLLKFTELLTPFTISNWKFNNDNVQELYANMSIADQQSFNFDMKKLDWVRHSETNIMGLRVYVLKDPATTLPQARIKWQRLKMAHMTLKALLVILPIFLVGYMLFKMFL